MGAYPQCLWLHCPQCTYAFPQSWATTSAKKTFGAGYQDLPEDTLRLLHHNVVDIVRMRRSIEGAD